MIIIKIHNIYGLKEAIWGMRNPKDSNHRIDSEDADNILGGYKLGAKDLELAKNLASGGPVHAKYRRFIEVYLDITAPFYWWKEFDTYKVGTVANSCSTMHTIHKQEITLDDFSHEHLQPYWLEDLKDTIDKINNARELYLSATSKEEKETYWWQMIQTLPSSYNQRRTIKLNYEVLVGIYKHRRNHKLQEWRDFCDWIEGLPYSELITQQNTTE